MYEWINKAYQSNPILSVTRLCSFLGVIRSGYYCWLHRKDKPAKNDDIQFKELIYQIVLEFVGYRYRRVTSQLQRRGYKVNRKKVLRLMREEGLLCIRRRSKIRTTISNHGLPAYPKAKNMVLTNINQLWVSDITYIGVSGKFLYLTILLDAYSRKCIGWHLSKHIDTDLVLTAFKKALETRNHIVISGIVHHSDREVQYSSLDYTEHLKSYELIISMSRVGNPYDNAYAESFIKTLKYEEVYQTEYESFKEAYEGIEKFIELYNRKRLHSSLYTSR